MTLEAAMASLAAAGTAQNRKVYARHGAPEPLFGVSFAHLHALQKKIRADHALAIALWATGNTDARHLATLVADPAAARPALLAAWVRDCNYGGLAGLFASRVVAPGPHARSRALAWIDSPRPLTAYTGWQVVACGAERADVFTDEDLLPLVERLAATIHTAPNDVRHAMNAALIGIGARDGACAGAALAAAARIGRVEVDHGQTCCKTPDAAAYIRKTLAHRHALAVRRAARRAARR